MYKVLSQVMLIGCQSAFSFKDRKGFLCKALLQSYKDQSEFKMVVQCIGSLLNRLRQRSSMVTQTREQQAVNVCKLNSIDDYYIDDPDPQDLDKLCLQQLGITSWK